MTEQEEALEEGYKYHVLGEFEDLIQACDVGEIMEAINPTTLKILRDYIDANRSRCEST